MAALTTSSNETTAAAFAAQIARLDPDARAKATADALIGTRNFPPGYVQARNMAMEALAYHQLRPYPYWQFADWKTEERGPLPRCLPLPRRIVQKGANWLFGKPVQVKVAKNEKLEAFLRDAWQRNSMPIEMVAASERGGYQGGVALKWSYDERAKTKLKIQTLSVIDDCRLFYDPFDRKRLLMARVQFPFWNAVDGEWYLYREEWTDELEVHYKPMRADFARVYRSESTNRNNPVGSIPVVAGTKEEPDVSDKWVEDYRTANKFGIIPLWQIRNIDNGGVYGLGDLHTDMGGGMLRIIDRINLTFHLMDKSNQFDTEPVRIFLDVNAGPDQIDRRLAPGETLSLKSDPAASGDAGKGQAIQLESSGAMREHMMAYAQELRREILDTVGSVDIRPEEVGNKGAMTEAVLAQLYAPLIESTEEKRKTYGEDGVCKFLERCAIGLKNLGAREDGIRSVNEDNEETFDVQLTWPDMFKLSEDEKTAKVARVTTEVDDGYMTHERAIEIVAATEGVEDVVALKEELKDAIDQKARMQEAAVDTAEAKAKAAFVSTELEA